MENTTFTQSSYIDNYNALKLSLLLDLGIKINLDNEVISFSKVLEGVTGLYQESVIFYFKKSKKEAERIITS